MGTSKTLSQQEMMEKLFGPSGRNISIMGVIDEQLTMACSDERYRNHIRSLPFGKALEFLYRLPSQGKASRITEIRRFYTDNKLLRVFSKDIEALKYTLPLDYNSWMYCPAGLTAEAVANKLAELFGVTQHFAMLFLESSNIGKVEQSYAYCFLSYAQNGIPYERIAFGDESPIGHFMNSFEYSLVILEQKMKGNHLVVSDFHYIFKKWNSVSIPKIPVVRNYGL